MMVKESPCRCGMECSKASVRPGKVALTGPFRRLKVLLAASLLFCAPVMVWPSVGLADLVAVGDRSMPSYRVGVALSAVVTLASGNTSINLNILPSNDRGGDHVRSVLSRLADFAVLDMDQLGEAGVSANQLTMVRAIAVVQNADGQAAVLVTHQDENDEQVQAVIQALFNNMDKLAILLSATATSDPASALKDLDLELHPAAARFYEEARQGGAAADDGSDSEAASLDAATTLPSPSTAQLAIETEILTRERDGLAQELNALSAQQQSMADQLSESERSREVVVTELETLRRTALENEAVIAQLSTELEVVLSERDQANSRRDELQRRVDSVSFTSVEEAAQSADDMRLRAEEAEARYQEAYRIGEACLQQTQGGSSQARQALLQIEQLEGRLRQVTRDHRQCIAERDASAN